MVVVLCSLPEHASSGHKPQAKSVPKVFFRLISRIKPWYSSVSQTVGRGFESHSWLLNKTPISSRFPLNHAVSTDSESGWLVASWNAPGGGGITTQAETPEKLFDEIRDAVLCYFDDDELPGAVKVHFREDPSVSVLEPA